MYCMKVFSNTISPYFNKENVYKTRFIIYGIKNYVDLQIGRLRRPLLALRVGPGWKS